MTERKSYSDPSRDLGNSGSGEKDLDEDRQKDLGSRHEEGSRGTGSGSDRGMGDRDKKSSEFDKR